MVYDILLLKYEIRKLHRLNSRGGQANFFESPQIANPKIFLRCASPQIANPQISTKHWITLSPNTPKGRCLKTICVMYKFEWEHYMLYLRKSMNLWTCGSFERITKKSRSANHKSVKCHICWRSANLTNYLNLNLRFAELVCGTLTFA